ncbi:MAG TPA: hypothetical protein VJZ27_00460, partial [Aggregatilineales bacterium]|nr:hypothetical protein [Aggregatilineales bacterium]
MDSTVLDTPDSETEDQHYEAKSQKPAIPFHELTLWQVLWLFMYRPGATLRRFLREIQVEDQAPDSVQDVETPAPDVEAYDGEGFFKPYPLPDDESLVQSTYIQEDESASDEMVIESIIERLPQIAPGFLAAYIWTIICALIAGRVLWKAALEHASTQSTDLKSAPLWLFVSMMIYIALSIIISLAWWRNRLGMNPESDRANESGDTDSRYKVDADDEITASADESPVREFDNPAWLENFFAEVERYSVNLMLMPVGAILAYFAYSQNVIYTPTGDKIQDVVFTTSGFITWAAAILVWFCALSLDMNAVMFHIFQRLIGEYVPEKRNRITRLLAWRPQWQQGVLLAIMMVAAFFRLYDLSVVPPEMTSDHIEKLLDSLRVADGYRGVFFPNNAGREGFQMYFIAFLGHTLGLGFSFETIKLATAIEGLLTVFLAYQLGVTMLGHENEENRRLGVWSGLSLAALMAVSSWHVMLSRLG